MEGRRIMKKKKNKLIEMNNKSTGKIRARMECIVDCPKCNATIKVIEKIKDNNKAYGQLIVTDK